MKTILITGASSGIGAATARHFQAKGWNVIATMRTPENSPELGALENLHLARLDVTDAGSIATAVAEGIEDAADPTEDRVEEPTDRPEERNDTKH